MGGKAFYLFADVIMNYIVVKAMEITPLQYKPFVFYRYVDDCFSVSNDKKSVIEFEKIINSIHPNTALTTELQFKNRLSFLDVLEDNSGPNLVTSAFRKPTHTGLYSKWNSFVPSRFKINLINCLLDRCYRICSSYEIIGDEFEQIKTMLSRNGYPTYVLDNVYANFLIVSSQLSHYFRRKKILLLKNVHSFAVFRCFIVANSQLTEVFPLQTLG